MNLWLTITTVVLQLGVWWWLTIHPRLPFCITNPAYDTSCTNIIVLRTFNLLFGHWGWYLHSGLWRCDIQFTRFKLIGLHLESKDFLCYWKCTRQYAWTHPRVTIVKTVTAEPTQTRLLYHLQAPPVLAVLYSIRHLHGKPGQYQSGEVLLSSHCLAHCDHLTYINGEE